MSQDQSADDVPLVSPQSVCETVQSILRAAQVAGWTDDALEQATGLKARRIKSYRVEGKEPSLSAALSLAVVLGTRHLNTMLARIGYIARPLDEADELQPMQIAADAMGHLSTIARAAADNRIDHSEKPVTTEAADMLIATVLPLSSAGQAA